MRGWGTDKHRAVISHSQQPLDGGQGFALRGSRAEQTTVQGGYKRSWQRPQLGDLLREQHVLHHLRVPRAGALGQHGPSPGAVPISSSLVPHRDHPGARQHPEHWGSLAELPPCTWGLLLPQHKSPLQGTLLEAKAQEPELKVLTLQFVGGQGSIGGKHNHFFLLHVP